MLNVEWDVAKSTKTCAATGRPLEVGEEYYAALREEGDGFIRQDFSREAWPQLDKSRFFSYWRTRLAAEETRRPRLTIDLDAVYGFFLALGEAAEERQRVFRYIAALVLVRKRILRLDGTERRGDGEWLQLFDRRAKRTISVAAPPLNADDLRRAQEALSQIFECQLSEENIA